MSNKAAEADLGAISDEQVSAMASSMFNALVGFFNDNRPVEAMTALTMVHFKFLRDCALPGRYTELLDDLIGTVQSMKVDALIELQAEGNA